MGKMQEWMTGMLFMAAACGIMEQIVPPGGLKKTVRFVVSLALMNGLLSPLYAIL